MPSFQPTYTKCINSTLLQMPRPVQGSTRLMKSARVMGCVPHLGSAREISGARSGALVCWRDGLQGVVVCAQGNHEVGSRRICEGFEEGQGRDPGPAGGRGRLVPGECPAAAGQGV